MPFLTWINDKDARARAKNVPFHLLNHVRTYGDESAENLLVHGDNLTALRALLPFYKGKVKCIYIDPPYNTGSAFEQYDDRNLFTRALLERFHNKNLDFECSAGGLKGQEI